MERGKLAGGERVVHKTKDVLLSELREYESILFCLETYSKKGVKIVIEELKQKIKAME